MRPTTSVFLVVAAILSYSIVASAKDLNREAASFFAAYDENDDGFWQKSEVEHLGLLGASSRNVVQHIWSLLDFDDNGEIPREVFIKHYLDQHLTQQMAKMES
eukprot:TRINITY_DN9408_c0_g1_i2.p2 TRINITY_DN9408_c0_g1~~TRINITY_DN9408_c0_g1_i2.p2  ORF type:complete len:103 (+),score=7.05 TRINITY_DN9408_c0_g1_i2:798-1106(+)